MKVRLRFANPSNPVIYVKGSELVPHPLNWRTHPTEQIDALKGILAEVGIADALKGYRLPDGRVQLIDGHARAEVLPDQDIPILLLDVNEEEAAKLLASFDPVGDMAGMDAAKLLHAWQPWFAVRHDPSGVRDPGRNPIPNRRHD